MAEKNNPFSRSDLAALARSPDGRALLQRLRQTDDDQLRRAMALAASGDMAGAGAVLAPLLADPGIRAILDRMGGQ